MPMIARYVASYAGYEAGTDPTATGAESGPMAVSAYGDAAYGEVVVTEAEAVAALVQAQGYIQALANDYVAWVTPLDARAAGLSLEQEALWNGFRAFVNSWRSFYDTNQPSAWYNVPGSIDFSLRTRSVRDGANSYLAQAGQWRQNLIAAGGKPNTGVPPAPAGAGGLFQWPSLSDVPWWVWLLGAVGVAAWLGVPQALMGRAMLPARRRA